jgi:hypothetical protein
MVINNLSDDDTVHMLGVESAIGKHWQRVVVRGEDQPVRTPKMHGELTGAVTAERMAVARQCVHVLERGGVHKESQALLEMLPVTGEAAFACPLLGAGPLELLVRPIDVDDITYKHAITFGVII